ncbi:MAG: hypothetical protein ACI4KR_09600 [Ruminiclostridium sp.]
MKEIIKSIGCARTEEVIAVAVEKGNGTPEFPIDFKVKYYTKEGIFIGEIRLPMNNS